jgi:hypothetical protein
VGRGIVGKEETLCFPTETAADPGRDPGPVVGRCRCQDSLPERTGSENAAHLSCAGATVPTCTCLAEDGRVSSSPVTSMLAINTPPRPTRCHRRLLVMSPDYRVKTSSGSANRAECRPSEKLAWSPWRHHGGQ